MRDARKAREGDGREGTRRGLDGPPRRRAVAWLTGLGALGALGAVAWSLARAPRDGEGARRLRLEIHAPGGAGVDLGRARVAGELGATVLAAERRGPDRLHLELEPGRGELELRVPGACPVALPRKREGEIVEIRLEPVVSFEVKGKGADLGHDAPFSVEARIACPDALTGEIAWRQVEGNPLAALETEDGGRRIRGRTPGFSVPEAERPGWGIVPISPRTRGAFALEARVPTSGGILTRRVELAAIPRASGLPTLSVGQRVLLAGEGFRIRAGAEAGGARLGPGPSGLTSFEASRPGRWKLIDAEGRELRLSAGRHDEMPLDCGRSGCHGGAAEHAFGSPMTTVLFRGLEGALGERYDPRCALACHATGEPGLPGGFTDVLEAFPGALPERPHPGAWAELPRALRRLGGVGCTACHGPAQIPEPSARWAVLRGDVCATCHDAPPRYGHVVAWRASRMARADARPEARRGECARCHTTAGFLGALGVRPLAEGGAAPAHAGPVGIACAACHAPHGKHEGSLLRSVPLPPFLGPASLPASAAPSAICLPCHAPGGAGARENAGLPFASAAAIWLGTGGEGEGGATLASAKPAPHAAVPKGCVGCHAAGPEGIERGAGHAFRADPEACKACHAATPVEAPDGARIAERAGRLERELRRRGALELEGEPSKGALHASVRLAAPPGSPLARAAKNLLLVLEDPAAGVHNAPYARALLDDVERVLEASPRR